VLVGVALSIFGFCVLEVYELGPVQLYAAPETVVTLNESVSPSQIGPLLVAVITGAVGSVNVTGPTKLDTQLFAVTFILSYTPCIRVVIVAIPEVLLVIEPDCGVPFFL
jgi:hypothetical protein